MITFRDVTAADLAWITELSQDPELLRYTHPEGGPPPESFWRERLANEGIWWIVLEDSEPVGWVFVWRREDGWELGYRLARRAWGRGIGRTAAAAALEWSDAQGIDVYADVVAPNAGSVRIVESLGFELARVGEWYGMEDRRYERPCG